MQIVLECLVVIVVYMAIGLMCLGGRIIMMPLGKVLDMTEKEDARLALSTILLWPRPQSDVKLSKCERAILTVLAQHGRCEQGKLAILAGYAPSGGGFNNSVSALRTDGYITKGWPAEITAEGYEALGPCDPLPEGDELFDYWVRRSSKCEAEILRALRQIGSGSKEEIAAATESQYQADGGGFNNSLSSLRTKGLIIGRGVVELAPELQ